MKKKHPSIITDEKDEPKAKKSAQKDDFGSDHEQFLSELKAPTYREISNFNEVEASREYANNEDDSELSHDDTFGGTDIDPEIEPETESFENVGEATQALLLSFGPKLVVSTLKSFDAKYLPQLYRNWKFNEQDVKALHFEKLKPAEQAKISEADIYTAKQKIANLRHYEKKVIPLSEEEEAALLECLHKIFESFNMLEMNNKQSLGAVLLGIAFVRLAPFLPEISAKMGEKVQAIITKFLAKFL